MRSKPIVDAFHAWLLEERQRQLPKSKLVGAINYFLNRWESFTRFLESGAVPLDNNLAERTLKYPILGRNYAESKIMRSWHRSGCVLF